jgi:hypothetical protein
MSHKKNIHWRAETSFSGSASVAGCSLCAILSALAGLQRRLTLSVPLCSQQLAHAP